jgi:hypothetical protein
MLESEHADGGGRQREVPAGVGRKSQPAGAEHPQQMAVGYDRRVSRHPPDLLERAIRTPPDGAGVLATRTAVAPQGPARMLGLDLNGGQPVVPAVVPFLEVLEDPGSLADSGQPAGVDGALQRTGENRLEVPAVENRPQSLGLPPAIGSQRNVRPAGVPAAAAPLRLPMADEDDSRPRLAQPPLVSSTTLEAPPLTWMS